MNKTLQFIVNKLKIDLSKPLPIKINEIGRNDLARIFADLGFTKGAEIGVDRGAFSEILCKSNPRLHLSSIDPWSIDAFEEPSNRTKAMKIQLENHYQDAKNRLAKYNCQVIRKKSMDAVQDFENNSLDFVYIDSNHNFVEVANDIYRWEKKVKPGGIVSGHDYEHFPLSQDNHVKHIVDAYAQAFEIPYYFELGIDRHHSWFWVKS